MNKVKRIAALIGVILIISMYIITLISAFIATEKAPGLFLASIFSSIVIPIMLWFFIKIYGWVHKENDAELPDQSNTQHPIKEKN